jgi:hypothetical protein
MKLQNLIKPVIASALCLSAIQVQAQSVTGAPTQTSEQANSITYSTLNANKPWLKSEYLQASQDESLKKLFENTLAQLKSPDRVQKGGGDLGGGNALVCNQGGKMSTELLDLHEAEKNGVEIDFGPGKTFQEKLDYVFDRLAKVSPVRAETYRSMSKEILTTATIWAKNTNMPLIDDVKVSNIPQGCLLVLSAYQRPVEQKNLPNAKTYTINADMFAMLNEDSKAALILHEVLYREARFSGKKDSDFARDMVATIASNEILDMTLLELNKIYSNNGLACLENQSFLIFEANRTDGMSCGFMARNELNLKFKYNQENWIVKGYSRQQSLENSQLGIIENEIIHSGIITVESENYNLILENIKIKTSATSLIQNGLLNIANVKFFESEFFGLGMYSLGHRIYEYQFMNTNIGQISFNVKAKENFYLKPLENHCNWIEAPNKPFANCNTRQVNIFKGVYRTILLNHEIENSYSETKGVVSIPNLSKLKIELEISNENIKEFGLNKKFKSLNEIQMNVVFSKDEGKLMPICEQKNLESNFENGKLHVDGITFDHNFNVLEVFIQVAPEVFGNAKFGRGNFPISAGGAYCIFSRSTAK